MPALHWRGQGLLVCLLRVLLACCLVAHDSAAAGAVSPVSDTEFSAFVEDAAKCADSPVPSLLYARYDHETRLATLNVEAKWLSSQRRALDDITVCTNSNFDRLHMLEAQCKSWGGPVSAVIYLPLEFFNQSNVFLVEQAARQLDGLHSRVEESGACMLDMVLVSELLRPSKAWAYPYNSLRNQAIARTKTKLLVLLDVDFLLSKGLRQCLLRRESWQALLHDTYTHKDVVVLPAFETKPGLPIDRGMTIADRAHRSSKENLRAMFMEQEVVRFAPFYKRGHTATDFPHWFSASRPYPVTFEPGFEPFVLMSRVHVPWYDERFRGYGWDKITHIYQMDQLGYNLVVHPHGFLVHRPHPPSAGYNKTFTGPAYSQGHKPTQNMDRLNKIARDMMRDVRMGRYPPFGVTALAGCRRLDLFSQGATGADLYGASQAAGAAAAMQGGSSAGPRPSQEEREELRLRDPVVEWW